MKAICKTCNIEAINVKEGRSGDLVYAECSKCGIFATGIGVAESHFDVVGREKKLFSFSGVEIIDASPKASGNGAVIYVPRKWIGSDVAVVRLNTGSKTTEPR